MEDRRSKGAKAMLSVWVTKKRPFLLTAYLFCGAMVFTLLSTSALASDAKWVAGEVIVKFKDTIPKEHIDEITARRSTPILYSSPFTKFKRLKVPAGKTEEETVAAFTGLPEVEYAELNYYAHAFFVPNDTYYPYQWHLKDPVAGINVETAWDITTGNPNVIVAIIDTGIAYENYKAYALAPDLVNTHFVPGYNFVRNNAHANDDDGHGTHVTGTIAQSTNNNLGTAGIAFNCSIMPVKVLNKKGVAPYSDVADGISWAVSNGARVINLSLGGPSDALVLKNAVANAYNSGVTIVCAAGNEYQSGNAPQYPAAYNDYCIAVGATRYDRTRAFYSNTGSYVDIVAPGGDLSAGLDQNGDGQPDGILQQSFITNPADFAYLFYQGTSMATPHVTGIAALLCSIGITQPDKIREALQNTAVDLGASGRDNEYGYGLVNAPAALNYFNIPGDINRDRLVDFDDLAVIADHWLQPEPAGANIPVPDGIINFLDFAVFAANCK